jgi:hypothetical protein
MTKLNQILAIEKGTKARVAKALTGAYHQFQKPALFMGVSRTYQPLAEDGETFPPESQRVQVKADTVLDGLVGVLTDMFDVVATKEWANTEAKADVVVDGQTLLTDVPATYLLFLEKQLQDLHTVIGSLPALDPTEKWGFDPSQDVFATDAVETTKTKKVPRSQVLYEATDKHPAQVEVYHEDIPVGRWSTVKFSGALPRHRLNQMTDRVDTLLRAVKFAREEANSITVDSKVVGAKVLDFVFAVAN